MHRRQTTGRIGAVINSGDLNRGGINSGIMNSGAIKPQAFNSLGFQ